MQGERYYFHVKGSMQGEIEPTQGEIEMSLGNRSWEGEIETNITLINSEFGWRGILESQKSGTELNLDLHKSGNELSLDSHKSGNELSLDLHKSGNELHLDLYKSGNELRLDLHKSGNELSLDLHINESPKSHLSLLEFSFFWLYCLKC